MHFRLFIGALIFSQASLQAMDRPADRTVAGRPAASSQQDERKAERQRRAQIQDKTLKDLLFCMRTKNWAYLKEVVAQLDPNGVGISGYTSLGEAAKLNTALPAAVLLLWLGANDSVQVEGETLRNFARGNSATISTMINIMAATKQAIFDDIARKDHEMLSTHIRELAKILSELAYPEPKERPLEDFATGIAETLGQITIKAYIAQRYNLNQALIRLPLKVKDDRGNNILHCAVCGDIDFMQIIYRFYPELSQEKNNAGKTPVDLAEGEKRDYLLTTQIKPEIAESERQRFAEKSSCILI